MRNKHNISEEGDRLDFFGLCKEKQYESILQHFIDSGGGHIDWYVDAPPPDDEDNYRMQFSLKINDDEYQLIEQINGGLDFDPKKDLRVRARKKK